MSETLYDEDTYPGCVLDLYRSEVFGEKIALALLPWARSELERYKLGTIAQLETETKARLRPFLARHGLPLEEEDVSGPVNGLLTVLTRAGWREFVQGMAADLPQFLARFEEIEAMGPAEDAELLHSMVVHERSLIRFTELELEGSEDSLADVIALLKYPLPRPLNG